MELVIGALIAFAVELLVLALAFAPRSTRDTLVRSLGATAGRLRVRRPRGVGSVAAAR